MTGFLEGWGGEFSTRNYKENAWCKSCLVYYSPFKTSICNLLSIKLIHGYRSILLKKAYTNKI